MAWKAPDYYQTPAGPVAVLREGAAKSMNVRSVIPDPFRNTEHFWVRHGAGHPRPGLEAACHQVLPGSSSSGDRSSPQCQPECTQPDTPEGGGLTAHKQLTMSRPSRLTALILVPVLLLAGIAAFGLVEYRHAIGSRRTPRGRPVGLRGAGGAGARKTHHGGPAPRPPCVSTETSHRMHRRHPRTRKLLRRATVAEDVDSLRKLLTSEAHTTAGIPVGVLAAWRLFGT